MKNRNHINASYTEYRTYDVNADCPVCGIENSMSVTDDGCGVWVNRCSHAVDFEWNDDEDCWTLIYEE